MYNKSTTYVYPIVHDFLNLSMNEYIFNTYIYNEEVKDSYTITYSFTERSSLVESVNLYKLDTKFKESTYLADIIETDLNIAYVLNRPLELKSLFSLFEEGKYSQYSEEFKFKILDYFNLYYRRYTSTIKRIQSVLFNNPNYRLELSNNLGYNIPKNIELSSKPSKENETFFKSKFITIQNNLE